VKTSFAVALLAGLAFAAGCGERTLDLSGLHGPDPKPPIPPGCSGGLAVHTGVFGVDGTHYMVVGEVGTAEIVVCVPALDTTIISTDPAVVSVSGDTIRALALGRAVIVGETLSSYEGFSDSETVKVVTSLADSVKVALQRGWEGTGARYDSTYSLMEVSVPASGSVFLLTTVFLDGWYVFGDPITVSSGNPAVAVATENCRPKAVDPDCSVVGPGWWVTAMSVGATTLTVTVPHSNASTSFVVKVF
jgi:hypothetical protein